MVRIPWRPLENLGREDSWLRTRVRKVHWSLIWGGTRSVSYQGSRVAKVLGDPYSAIILGFWILGVYCFGSIVVRIFSCSLVRVEWKKWKIEKNGSAI